MNTCPGIDAGIISHVFRRRFGVNRSRKPRFRKKTSSSEGANQTAGRPATGSFVPRARGQPLIASIWNERKGLLPAPSTAHVTVETVQVPPRQRANHRIASFDYVNVRCDESQVFSAGEKTSLRCAAGSKNTRYIINRATCGGVSAQAKACRGGRSPAGPRNRAPDGARNNRWEKSPPLGRTKPQKLSH